MGDVKRGLLGLGLVALLIAAGYAWWRMPGWRYCDADTAYAVELLTGFSLNSRALDAARTPLGATCYYESYDAGFRDVAIVRVAELGGDEVVLYVRRPGRAHDDYQDPAYASVVGN